MSKLHKAQTQQGHSRHFFEFIRAIGEAKAKQEEDMIVEKDLVDLKKTMSESSLEGHKMKECVVRMFYAEMLGHSAEFGHINAVNLASSTDLHYKRTGYIATWLCVNPEHEFMYLIVSCLQRDLNSSNFLEISSALSATAKLIRPELMTCINSAVTGLVSHPNALVRKKAVLTMHAFYKKSEGLIADMKLFRSALCDKDPSVMGAALCLFHDVILNDPDNQKDLLPSFISILKQITEHRLSREFDYHRVPAPWLQIRLLRLIAVLAADDQQMSEKAAEVVAETMKRADNGLNIGNAVIAEAINTITSLYPIPDLIEGAAEAISKFLTAANANMKYLGITALSKIVKIDRKYAQEHQHIVIGCLEDPDDTIRRKTLTLLFAMCNENNVEAIATRLIKFLSEATDQFLRRELVSNLCNVIEEYSTNSQWRVDTMNKILELGAEHVPQSTIQGMLKLIAEGEGEDEAEDAALRTYCVETYFILMESPEKVIPSALYEVAAWVMGEYGFLTKKISRVMMLDRLCDMLERVDSSDTKGWIITAMMKIVAHNGSLPDNVEDLVAKFKNSRSVALQQRCYEFLELAKMPPVLKKVEPLDGCCEDIEVDEHLSFLDALVEDALSQGARPYERKEVRLGGGQDTGDLRTEAYKTAQTNVVDEDDLTAEKFQTEETEKLVIRDTAKRWGAKNLMEEAAVVQTDLPQLDSNEPSQERTVTGHVDPMADAGPRKPTKNEKFMNDIFGGDGGSKKTKKRKTNERAKEAARRAVEAEAATRGMTTENQRGHSIEPEVPAVVHDQRPEPPPILTSSTVPHVQTNLQKQLVADGLRVRVGVMGDADISRVVMTLLPPQKCNLANVVCPLPNATVRDNTVMIPKIPGKQPAFAELSIQATDYPVGGGLTVNISYGSDGGPGSTVGKLALALPDLLRPVTITTDVFGQMWPKHTGEFKVQLKFPKQLTPDVLGQYLMQKANLKIIQVIGKECIAGATVVPVGHYLLAHMAVDGGNANTTIRSNSKEFSEVIGRMLAAGLAPS